MTFFLLTPLATAVAVNRGSSKILVETEEEFLKHWLGSWRPNQIAVPLSLHKRLVEVPGLNMPLFHDEAPCSKCVKARVPCVRPAFAIGTRMAITRCTRCFIHGKGCDFVAPAKKSKETEEEKALRVRKATAQEALEVRVRQQLQYVRRLIDELDYGNKGLNGKLGRFEILPSKVYKDERALYDSEKDVREALRAAKGPRAELAKINNEKARDDAVTDKLVAEAYTAQLDSITTAVGAVVAVADAEGGPVAQVKERKRSLMEALGFEGELTRRRVKRRTVGPSRSVEAHRGSAQEYSDQETSQDEDESGEEAEGATDDA